MRIVHPSPTPPKAHGRGQGGKQKLVQAALDLVATTSTVASLGIREVTRSAGLAPNAFYRHFRSLDQLGLEVIDRLGSDLRTGLRGLRETWQTLHPEPAALKSLGAAGLVAAFGDVIRQSVAFTLEFIVAHRVAYVVGIRLLHGHSPVLRQGMEQLLERCAVEMADDAGKLLQLAGLSPATVLEISRSVIRQMSFFATDYVNQSDPTERERIQTQAERFIARIFAGEIALRSAEQCVAGQAGDR